MTLVYLSLAWLAGIALAGNLPNTFPLFIWLLAGALSLFGLLLSRGQRSKRLLFGCVLLLVLGAARYTLAVPAFDEDNLAYYNDGGFVSIEGLIIDAPDVRDTQTNLRLRATSITLEDGQSQPVKGLALIQADRFGDYRYGDVVRVRGELLTPPTSSDFSYRDFLAQRGIHTLVQFSQVETLARGQGSLYRRVTLGFRVTTQGVIMRLLPDPQSSLLSGILLGVESGISQDVRDDFNATGATHVIAISGANLAILAGVLRGITRRWMRPKISALVTVLVIFIYTLFVGGDAAVMRAFVMATVGISGEELVRRSYAPASLSLTALVMTAINPLLLGDVSFLLSFLSTWGIVLYVDPLSNAFERGLSFLMSGQIAARLVSLLAESFIVTLAAQITTTPIIALFFGRFSLVSLPVNLLIIPAQAPLMMIGGVATLVALVVWPLGQLIAWVDWLYLTYTLVVVRLFADLPFASVVFSPSPGIVFGFFVLLFGGTFVVAQTEQQRAGWRQAIGRRLGTKVLATAGLWVAVLAGALALSLPDGRLHVTFMDVNGSALLIETPGGRTILVDGGGSGRELSTALGDALPFWQRKIDLLIITQPLPSHMSGLPSALNRYQVDALLYNGQRGDSGTADALWMALEEQGVTMQVAQPGMQVRIDDGVILTVLHTQPIDREIEEGEPGQPIVLMLEYDGVSFLLTGDLPPVSEQALLVGEYSLGTTVLQVPWHGNQAVNSSFFLDAAQPQLAVIPVPTGGRSTFPHQEVLDRLADVNVITYRTDRDGTVRIATDGTRLWVWPRRLESGN